MSAPRLDWRFLLADPSLDRVGFVGDAGEKLLQDLERASRSVDILDGSETRSEAGDYAIVVACDPSKDELSRAAARVIVGGRLVVVLQGTAGGGRARRDGTGTRSKRSPQRTDEVAARLGALGFDELRTYWHWPSWRHCTRIIPLDDPRAVRYALTRSGQGLAARVRAWLLRQLLEMGRLSWVTTSTTIVGRQAGRNAPVGNRAEAKARTASSDMTGTPSIVHDFLRLRVSTPGTDPPAAIARRPFIVLTPRFRNSSNLVFLLLGADGTQPVQVVKVSRLPGTSAMMEREAAFLTAIEQRRPGGFDSIPRLVAFEAFRGHEILVQSAIAGSALDRATVRRSSRHACEAMLAWLIDVQTATRVVSEGDGGFERLIERELEGLEEMFPHEERLIGRTRELVQPLALARLPRVLEHRDLSHPNLIMGPDGRIGVIDWEQGDLEGLPAADLFFFLRYVGMALSGAPANEGSTRVLDRAFFERRGWARGPVSRYAQAMGLARDWLTPLFVATWMRQVHGLAQRVASSEGGSGPDPRPAADWLSKDWRFEAWRHVIEQADRLDWDDVP